MNVPTARVGKILKVVWQWGVLLANIFRVSQSQVNKPPPRPPKPPAFAHPSPTDKRVIKIHGTTKVII